MKENFNLRQSIAEFIDYIYKIRRLSSATAKIYSFNLKRFADWIEDNGYNIEYMQPMDILDFIGFLREGNLSERACNQNLSSIKTFVDFLRRFKGLASSPAAAVRNMKTNKPLPKYLTESQVDKIIEKCQPYNTFKGMRSRCILMTFIHTGIRCAELCNLRVSDVRTDADYIKVTGKGNKQRLIPFGLELHNSFVEWISIRKRYLDSLSIDDNGFLFVTDKGLAVQGFQVRIIVKDILKGIVPLRLAHPHVLRHTFATLLMNHGARLESIRALLGHESIATTAIYEHVSYERMKEQYNMAFPSIQFNRNMNRIKENSHAEC